MNPAPGLHLGRMTEPERIRISNYVEEHFGIKMPASKKALLESRLAKRLNALGFKNYGLYFDFVTQDPAGQDEYLHFEDLVSTHETSFFRERQHFDYLVQTILPPWLAGTGTRPISALSAACSTGEEAYTLAMLLAHALTKSGRLTEDFQVEGVDLSPVVVETARRGIYPETRTHTIPAELQKTYLMHSKDKHKDLCRMVPELRCRMVFRQANLLEPSPFAQARYDLLFCRNVLIYFDRENQRRVLEKLLGCMDRDSYLFLGHAETMVSMDMGLKTLAHGIYQLR